MGRVAIVCRQVGGLVEADMQILYSAGMRYRPEDSAIELCSRILLHPLQEKHCILKDRNTLIVDHSRSEKDCLQLSTRPRNTATQTIAEAVVF